MKRIISVSAWFKYIFISIFFILNFTIYSQETELVLQTGHSSSVYSVCFSKDGKYILTGGLDNTLILWETYSGKQLRSFTGHTDPVSSVCFSPDMKYVLSGSWDKTLKLWDISTGKVVRAFTGHSDLINSVSYSPDGRFALSGSSDKTVKVWEILSGKEAMNLSGHSASVNSVSFSPDGKQIVSGSSDGTIRIWNSSNGKKINTIKRSPFIKSVSFSSDNNNNILFNETGKLILYNIQYDQEMKQMTGHQFKDINSVSLSPDGKYAISGSVDKTIKLWELSTGAEIKTFSDEMGTVNSICFSPDGKYILSGSDDDINNVRLWEISSGTVVRKYSGYESIDAFSFSKDGKNVLFAASDNTAKLWDFNKGKEIGVLTGHKYGIQTVCFSPDGKTALTGCNDGTMKLWDILSKKEIRTISAHAGKLNSVSFSSDGKYALSCSSDLSVKLWETTTWKELKKFYPYGEHYKEGVYAYIDMGDDIFSSSFSPDGKNILTCTSKGDILLYEISTEKSIRFSGHTDAVFSVSFSPDGTLALSSGADNTIRIWDVKTGKLIKTFTDTQPVFSTSFSSDGKFILSGNSEGKIKLWDMSGAKVVKTFTGHRSSVYFTRFTPDGKRIISCGGDKVIKLWDVANEKEILSIFYTDRDNWIVITPDGRFDGTSEGMKHMHYVKGLEVIPLESFFEKYYTPGLFGVALLGKAPEVSQSKITELKRPPKVAIITEDADNRGLKATNIKSKEVAQSEYKCTVEVTDMGGGINEVRLYHNGKLIEGSSRGFKPINNTNGKQTFVFTVNLLSGENELVATAFNNERTESVPDKLKVIYKGIKAEANLYVLAIGINQYKNSKYNLNLAVPDAKAFLGAVTENSDKIFKTVEKKLILNTEATKANILKSLTEIQGKVQSQDVFIFYYAGHGVMTTGNEKDKEDFFLVLTEVTQIDFESQKMAPQCISAKELNDILINIKAQKQLVLLDACESGGATEAFASRGLSEEKAMAQLARSAGVVVLAAAGINQTAKEFSQLGHGVFTYSLIEGLKGAADGANKDKKITVLELKAWLDDNVPELTQKYQGTTQYPTGFCKGQDFPVKVIIK